MGCWARRRTYGSGFQKRLGLHETQAPDASGDDNHLVLEAELWEEVPSRTVRGVASLPIRRPSEAGRESRLVGRGIRDQQPRGDRTEHVATGRVCCREKTGSY